MKFIQAGTAKQSRLFAFTLIEMLMAISLVAILSTVAISQYVNFSQDARIAVTREKLQELRVAIVGDARLVANGQYMKPGYLAQMGRVPTTLDELVTQGAQSSYSPDTKLGWRGPYVSTSGTAWKADAWGEDIVYSSGARTLTSKGPDRALSTTDDIQFSF